MKFAEFFSGQRIIKALLDFLHTAKSDAITERTDDTFQPGVLENTLNSMAIVGKDVDSLLQTDRVKVDTGVAIKNGERILIDDATIPYNVSNTTLQTDDGRGNLVSTPASTGSFDIPLTLGSINYLYIAYLLTTDPTEFTLHKRINNKQFYKRTDGYEIQVNTTGTNPDPTRFIFLGTVDMTEGTGSAIASNISLSGREIARIKLGRVGIETPNSSKSDRPAVYNLGNNKFALDDHIKAVGTGSVSPTNPHGLAIGDLGIQPNQTVEEHRKLEHSNAVIAGVVGDPFPNGSAMFPLTVVVGGGQDHVTVRRLLSTEVVSVNGIGFGSAVFPNDVDVFFTDDGTATGTPLPADTYQIAFNSVTQQLDAPIAGTAPILDKTKLWIATVAWDGVDTIIGSVLDRRRIGGTVNRLQRWTTGGRLSNAITGQFGYNIDTNQMEYFNGSVWVSV